MPLCFRKGINFPENVAVIVVITVIMVLLSVNIQAASIYDVLAGNDSAYGRVHEIFGLISLLFTVDELERQGHGSFAHSPDTGGGKGLDDPGISVFRFQRRPQFFTIFHPFAGGCFCLTSGRPLYVESVVVQLSFGKTSPPVPIFVFVINSCFRWGIDGDLEAFAEFNSQVQDVLITVRRRH